MPTTLFTNMRLFEGKCAGLSEPDNVLVKSNTIAKISRIQSRRIAAPKRALSTVAAALDAGTNRCASPYCPFRYVVVDVHDGRQQLYDAAPGQGGQRRSDGWLYCRSRRGCNTFGLKRAIDEGFTAGPSIRPSGALISQTSGHCDFRILHDLPRSTGDKLHFSEELGFTAITDGEPEVLRRVRERLMRGASQVKLTAGGGVSSDFDPLDVSQFTEEEIHAAAKAAADWGTYVAVHAYTPRAIQESISAGVKCIEHGQPIDEPTAKLMAE